MDTREIIRLASEHLAGLAGKSFEIFSLTKPTSVAEAVNLAKLYPIISKISPLIGNLFEFEVAEYLDKSPAMLIKSPWGRVASLHPTYLVDML